MNTKPRFLFDVGVGKVVEDLVKSQSYDVLAVRNIDPKMTDADILEKAEKERCVVVTMDKDSGELVFASGRKHGGVLLLRLDDARSEEKLAVIKEIFDKHLNDLVDHFCVYQNQILRIR